MIKDSGIPHTFLRNNWYLENEWPIIDLALKTGHFIYSEGDGKTGWALKREYAEVAAKAVAGLAFPEVLELSGKPVTYKELGQALEQVIDQPIEIIQTDNQGFMKHLEDAGYSEEVAQMFVAIQEDIKKGQLDIVSDDFEKALDKPLNSLEDGLRELMT